MARSRGNASKRRPSTLFFSPAAARGLGAANLPLTAGFGRALALAVLALGLAPQGLGAERLADRLVVSINALSYTQRQVEAYISLREALRPDTKTPVVMGKVRAVVDENWREALGAFVEDMLVLQETQRLGSFQTEGQLVARYDAQVRERLLGGAALRSNLERLGVDAKARARFIDMALRVALFRKNKERQALGLAEAAGGERRDGVKLSQSQGADLGKSPGSSGKWLEDLKRQAVVRYYGGVETFVEIEPPRAPGDAS